jgi:hypothetical protein
MRVLWAVSSVGKGHVIRDIAIAVQLQSLADVEIDWLAPYPVEDFLRSRGHRVLECSSRLAGSGRLPFSPAVPRALARGELPLAVEALAVPLADAWRETLALLSSDDTARLVPQVRSTSQLRMV